MTDFNELNFDLDGDGIADSYAEEIDVDGDGIVDTLAVDTNLDGEFDVVALDSDADGDFETIAYDSNRDGIFDAFERYEDTNGDGVDDKYSISYDRNQDGIIDTEEIFEDTNGDGYMETFTETHDADFDGDMEFRATYVDSDIDGETDIMTQHELVDTDGDGYEDMQVIGISTDGDDEFEVVEVYDYTDPASLTPVDYVEAEVYDTGLENFDPDEADPEDVCGNPAEDMENWEYQGETNRCAIYSQMFIIEEMTGEDLDIEELADIAEDNNWFSEEGGTPYLNMNKLLDYYGIENEMTFHNDISDIEECLANGGNVIVSVDSGEIWHGETDELFAPVDGADHAVQVIGIDYSDPDEPMVILNDSGSPTGCGEMVPLDVFMDAWEDGDCQMIACM